MLNKLNLLHTLNKLLQISFEIHDIQHRIYILKIRIVISSSGEKQLIRFARGMK